MPESDLKNLNFYWSTLFVRILYEQGIRRVIISPGSRSTPLTLAFAAHPGFEKHIAIDERSAAFMALGFSKAERIPCCLVCTSGTAVANYFPAVIEAAQSHVPLLVLTADRPPVLRGIGASQTIDQLKIFGDYPVFFHEAGEPKDSATYLSRIQHAAKQAVDAAVQQAGVAHLNFAFAKPFEPEPEFLAVVEQENIQLSEVKYSVSKTTLPPTHFDDTFWNKLFNSKKPLIIVGAENTIELVESIQELSTLLKAPILTEPGSRIPASSTTITGFDGFLRDETIQSNCKPDLILRFGREPVSKALQNFLVAHENVEQLRFLVHQNLEDETHTASSFLRINQEFEISSRSKNSPNDEWLHHWQKLQQAYYAFLEPQMFPTSPLTDGYVFHTLTPLIPPEAFSMLSNSFPVRDMALVGEYDGKEMYVNRGTAGIDGIISTTIGLSVGLNKPGVLFIGDIAFLHDSNALLSLGAITQPLIIFILNNGGGSIFKMLPINQYKRKYSDFFETPQQVSIAALCRAHKISHSLISRPEQLIPEFEAHIEQPGVHICECITDAEDSMELRRALWNFSQTES